MIWTATLWYLYKRPSIKEVGLILNLHRVSCTYTAQLHSCTITFPRTIQLVNKPLYTLEYAVLVFIQQLQKSLFVCFLFFLRSVTVTMRVSYQLCRIDECATETVGRMRDQQETLETESTGEDWVS